MATALEQFTTRAQRVLQEYWPRFKYSPSMANENCLALRFPLEGFLPSDIMFTNEARDMIRQGQIRETSTWVEAFRRFHEVTGNAYHLDANLPILEAALQGRCPTPELLVEIANGTSDLIMTPQASHEANRQAAEDVRRAELFEEFAPKLIAGPTDSMNKYAVALENKRIEARRNEMWNMPLSQLEEMKTRKNMRNMPLSELRKIATSNEPARMERIFHGSVHEDALPETILLLRDRGAAEVKAGIFHQIPDEWKIPGKDLTVPFSRNLLAQLPKELVAKLLQMYGNNQLTYACELTKFKLSQKK